MAFPHIERTSSIHYERACQLIASLEVFLAFWKTLRRGETDLLRHVIQRIGGVDGKRYEDDMGFGIG